MCRETTTSYRYCLATAVHTNVCLSHIDHTRRQIDSAPCPNLRCEVVNSDSRRCNCRDGGDCKRYSNAIAGDNGHSWSFEKEGRFRAKIESMEEREERYLKEMFNEIRIKKNELSFLKHTETQKNEGNSKRRKKNDKTSENQEGRPASEPPESSAAAVGRQDDADAKMGGDDQAVALWSKSAATQSRKTKKLVCSPRMCDLEREIEDLYQRWLRQGGKEPGGEKGKSNAWQKIKSDTYRPEPRRGSSDERQPSSRKGKKNRPTRSELLEREVEGLRGESSRSGSAPGLVKIKQEEKSDVEME